MAAIIQSDLVGLDFATRGTPFVALSKPDVDTNGLDFATRGTPFITPTSAPAGETFTYVASTSSSNSTDFVRQMNKNSVVSVSTVLTTQKFSSLSYNVNRSPVAALLKDNSIHIVPATVSSVSSTLAAIGAIIRNVTASAVAASNSLLTKIANKFHATSVSSTSNQSKVALLNKNVLINNSSALNKITTLVKSVTSLMSVSKSVLVSTYRNTESISINSIVKSVTKSFNTTASSIANSIADLIIGTYRVTCSTVANSSSFISKNISSFWQVSVLGNVSVIKQTATEKIIAVLNSTSVSKIPSLIMQAIITAIAYRSKTFEMIIELIVASNATISRQISTVFSAIVNTTTFINKLIKLAFAGNLSSTAEIKKDSTWSTSVQVGSNGSVGKLVSLVYSASSSMLASTQKTIMVIYSAISINTSAALTELKQLIATLISFFVTINNTDVISEEVIVTEKQITQELAGVEQVTLNLEGTERTIINL